MEKVSLTHQAQVTTIHAQMRDAGFTVRPSVLRGTYGYARKGGVEWEVNHYPGGGWSVSWELNKGAISDPLLLVLEGRGRGKTLACALRRAKKDMLKRVTAASRHMLKAVAGCNDLRTREGV